MRVLFVAGASPATVFALVPLATAVRHAGHDVVLATTGEMTDVAERSGLPFVVATDRPIADLLWKDRDGTPVAVPQRLAEEIRFAGTWFGRLAAAMAGTLYELAGSWRPDLVVGGTNSYAAGLVAARHGIPHVRLAWDALDARDEHAYADEELAPELAALGLAKLPPPDEFIDICPPGIRSPTAPPARMMRWVPANLQRRIEPWMLGRGDRPRVCVTSGTRVVVTESLEFLRSLAAGLAELDVEILVPAPDDVAAQLGEALPDMRVGWMPLDVLAPTCDVVVHHGGGVTAMTAMNAGVPQLVLPQWEIHPDSWERLAAFGAGVVLPRGGQGPDRVAEACQQLLTRPHHRQRARELAGQIAALPGVADQVPVLERLAG